MSSFWLQQKIKYKRFKVMQMCNETPTIGLNPKNKWKLGGAQFSTDHQHTNVFPDSTEHTETT